MKHFSAFLALILVLSITACSSPANNNKQEQKTTSLPLMKTTEKFTEETTEEHRENFYEKTTEEESVTQTVSTTEKEETTKKTDVKPSETTTQKPQSNSVPTTTKPQTKPIPSGKLPNYTPEAEIVALFNKINKYREEKSLNKLLLDPELCKMAYIRAEEQKVLKGHTRPNNSKYYSILDEYNYSYMGCGENIAFFPKLVPDDIFNKWKGSSEHDANMTESRWTKSGMALCKNADGSYIIVHLFAC